MVWLMDPKLSPSLIDMLGPLKRVINSEMHEAPGREKKKKLNK